MVSTLYKFLFKGVVFMTFAGDWHCLLAQTTGHWRCQCGWWLGRMGQVGTKLLICLEMLWFSCSTLPFSTDEWEEGYR
jgi:hypothetical protein